MMLVRFGLATGMMLAACGGSWAQSPLDGTYRPPPGGADGNSACGTTKFGYPLRVSNGTATLQTVSQGQLEGRVGADGSVRIENGRALVVGQIAAGKFTGSYTVGRCMFTLNYTRG